jgi:hypothetical protein
MRRCRRTYHYQSQEPRSGPLKVTMRMELDQFRQQEEHLRIRLQKKFQVTATSPGSICHRSCSLAKRKIAAAVHRASRLEIFTKAFRKKYRRRRKIAAPRVAPLSAANRYNDHADTDTGDTP